MGVHPRPLLLLLRWNGVHESSQVELPCVDSSSLPQVQSRTDGDSSEESVVKERKRYQARRAVCDRKVAYRSVGAAAKDKYALIEAGERVVTYRCDVCPWWHIGHRMPHDAYMRSETRKRSRYR